MPSLNTLKLNYQNLKNEWDINMINNNIKNLNKINKFYIPSFNTLKLNYKNLKNEWDINMINNNIKNLNKINKILNKTVMKNELILLKKKYKNL